MADLIEILVAGGLVGAAGTIAGILISRFFEYQDRRSEEKRWYAQYFLNLKIDALKKLQITLEDCNKKCHINGNVGVQTFEEYQKEIAPCEEAYRIAIRMAIIYLTVD